MGMRVTCRAMVCTLVVAGSLIAAPACASPRGRVFVRVGPPAPIVEVRSVAPGPRYVWVPGYHAWPRPRAVWVPGRWVRERRGWVFVDGRWR